MTALVITITERTGAAPAGMLPGVYYGPKETATSIALDKKAFEQLWKDAGESSIVVLKGIGDDKETLIHDVQWHPVTDEAVHVDFYVIERGKKVSVEVPLHFVGEAPVEKQGGVVVKVMHELAMEVRPSELPHHIEVDLSALTDMNSVITVGDITLPPSAEIEAEADEVVVSVTEAVEEDLSAPVGEALPEDMKTPAEEQTDEDKKEE